MKRLLLFFILCTSLSAQGAQWIKLPGPSGGDTYYYDRSKLYISGDEITYWKKIVFLSPQDTKKGLAASGLYRERINCAEHTLKMISYLLYNGNGGVIEYVPDHEEPATPIIPDTIGDIFEHSLCALVAQHKAEEKRRQEEERQRQEEEEKRKQEEQMKNQNCPPANAVPQPAPTTDNVAPVSAPARHQPNPKYPRIIEHLVWVAYNRTFIHNDTNRLHDDFITMYFPQDMQSFR
jgi:hypothetical protein